MSVGRTIGPLVNVNDHLMINCNETWCKNAFASLLLQFLSYKNELYIFSKLNKLSLCYMYHFRPK